MLCDTSVNSQVNMSGVIDDFVVYDSASPHLKRDGKEVTPTIMEELLNKKSFLLQSLEEQYLELTA